MRISRDELFKIIEDETVKVLQQREWREDEDDDEKESEQDRRERIFNGSKELDRLARGVVEKKKPRKKQCHAYNPFHSGKDGTFVNPEKESGSSSMAPPDGSSPDDCTWGQNRRNSANRSTQSTKRPCGRQGKYRCKDGSKKWEEELVHEDNEQQLVSYIEATVKAVLEDFLKAFKRASSGENSCSYKDILSVINQTAQAEKGTLGAKSKK